MKYSLSLEDTTNPRVRTIKLQAIKRANLPKNKYNFPLLEHTAELVGEPSDRTAYDVGGEPEKRY